MNKVVDLKVEELQKTTVKQDICIELFNLLLESKADIKANNGLDGQPRTQTDIDKIFEIVREEFLDYEYVRTSKRYIHIIENIRISDSCIDVLLSCTDTQHQGFIKKNSKDKKRLAVPFNKNEGSETFSNIVIKFDENTKKSAKVFFERSTGNTLKIFENMMNVILKKMRKKEKYKNLFVEKYVADAHTPFYFDINFRCDPIADKEIIERIKTGDFLDLCIVEKEIKEQQGELPFLEMTESINIFKPKHWKSDISFEQIKAGILKIGRKKQKGNQPSLYKLRYSEANKIRTVELRLEEENIASMCQKKKWFKGYERKVVDQKKIDDKEVFDDVLCRKMFNINIENLSDDET